MWHIQKQGDAVIKTETAIVSLANVRSVIKEAKKEAGTLPLCITYTDGATHRLYFDNEETREKWFESIYTAIVGKTEERPW